MAAHPQTQSEADVIRPGDRISVRVFGEPTLSAEDMLVRPSGMVPLPLLGEQKVANVTPLDLSKSLANSLKIYLKDPNVTVLLTPAPMVIHVMGEISSGGRKEYRDPITLPEVLAESGALTQYANRNGIYVLRGADRIRFRYIDLLRGSRPMKTFFMQQGDIVVVE